MKKDLSELQIGDQVILRYSTPFIHDQIAIVDRITKTQIIVGCRKFRMRDGYEVGGANGRCWSYYRIIPATSDQIEEVERRWKIKLDQERAYRLAVQICDRVRVSSTAAAAIPHLEAALFALPEEKA